MVSCFTMFQQFPMSMSTVENFEIKTENHQANKIKMVPWDMLKHEHLAASLGRRSTLVWIST